MLNEDNLWKAILEEIFTDFIRFIHPGVDEILDLRRGYVFLDKELKQVFSPHRGSPNLKIVDKLIKVYSKNGGEEFILIHIEVQAKYRKDFGRRMLTYYYRLLDKYNKPISAYAIFTEPTHKPRPGNFSLDFMGTKLSYDFNTYKISESSDDALLSNQNPFALVVLAARTAFKGHRIKDDDERDMLIKHLKLDLIKRLIDRKIERNKKEAIFYFINNYITFDLEETKTTFEKELEVFTKRDYTMNMHELMIADAVHRGKIEGKAEGVNKLKTELAQHLIKNFGFSNQQIAKMIKTPVKFVATVRNQTRENLL